MESAAHKYYGIIIAIFLFLIVWFVVWLRNKNDIGPYNFDALNATGAFEKFLQVYIDIFKFVLGLASGSIVLLIGSSSFRQSGNLPSSFTSPLFLLTASILYGILLMLFLSINYESYRHNEAPYTKFRYTRNVALGYSSLLSFIFGYIWLIYIATA
jgi:hypothetical protein